MLSFKKYCLILTMILVLLGCKIIFTESPKEVYSRYYDLFKNICNFNGNVEFHDVKSNYRIGGYQISYSKASGCSINNTAKDSFRQIKVDNGKIIITASDGVSKVYEDTEENRFNVGIPPGMGINPYYFLNTNLNKSKIKIFDENIEVTYKDDKIDLREYIKISNDKIDKIQVFSGGNLMQEIEYQNFKKISNNIYYPMSYVQKIFDKGGSVIKSVKVIYENAKISLCK